MEHAEPRTDERPLAELLRAHRDEILATWERAVRSLPPARELPRPLLGDEVPRLLEHLIEAADGTASPDRGAAVTSEDARALAAARLGLGFDLGEMAAEYAALREALVAVLEAAPFQLTLDHRRFIHRAIDGGIAAAVSQYHDATVVALEARAREVRNSERRFRATFDVANVGIAHVALDGTWLRANAHLSEMLGYPPDELRRLTFQAITHPDDVPRDVREAERLATGEVDSYRLDKRYVRKDGGIVWAKIAVSLVRPDDEEPYFVTVVEDVTERKRVLDELARSERRYTLATSATRDAIWEWELATNEVHWNDSIHSVFGYAPGEVAPEATWWLDRVHPDDREHVLASSTRAFAGTGDEWLEEYRFRHRDGRWLDVLDRSRIERDATGRAVRSYGSMRDVTDQKRVEREREMLLGVLGHDLRNPLAAIGAAADVMLRRRRLDERDAIFARRIASSVARMARLVTDLLEAARARAGALTIERRRADLAEVARAPIDELRASHPERVVTLERRGDTSAELDADRLAQVVSNLVGNALAHGAADRPVAVRVDGEGSDLVLEVHNQGPAIPEDLRARLFDPFAAGRPGGRSIGLGLFIVERIVAAHGGTVAVESKEGAGTTFRIVLPRSG